jgi:demethylmenaquinone methyltransferase/2-methoxy-6-polyprenyl-1,4-benzoquinol methylase
LARGTTDNIDEVGRDGWWVWVDILPKYTSIYLVEECVANLKGSERAEYVQEMFTRIAPRYDLMNRLMTAGQDVRWRREVISRARLNDGARLLDLGAGTGDLAREALRRHPGCSAVAADFTLEMMRVGQSRLKQSPPLAGEVSWSAADALNLAFPSRIFEAVVSGFLLRNVTDVTRSLAEQYRVLKAGGRIVALDTTHPPSNLLTPLINIHLHTIIPQLGTWLTGQAEAYQYLPESTENFLKAEQLASRMVKVGFRNVHFRRLMFGTVAIHWAEK